MYEAYLPAIQLEQQGLRVGGGAAANATAINLGLAKAALECGVCTVIHPGTYRIASASLDIPVGVVLLRGPASYLVDSTTLAPIPELEGLNFVGREPVFEPAFTAATIYVNAIGQERSNAAAYIQNNLATFNGYQYCVFVGPALTETTIAKRRYPDGAWTTATLAGFKTHSNDEHNITTVCVTPDGYIWVAGGFHDNALNTAGSLILRSNTVESIGTSISDWTATAIVGSNESEMTYIRFFKARDVQFMFYRDGVSGDGDWYLNKYSTTTGTWSRVGQIWQGKTDNNSLYPNAVFVDPRNGNIHVTGTIRNTGAVNHEDVVYSMSDDLGVTWKKSTGAVYTLPITKATAEKAAVTGALNASTGLGSDGGCVVTSDGTIYICMCKTDGSVLQNWAVWGKGGVWRSAFLTSGGSGLLRPKVVLANDRVFAMNIRIRLLGNEPARLMEFTDPLSPGVPIVLDQLNRYQGEVTLDIDAMINDRRLDYTVFQEGFTNAGTIAGEEDHYFNTGWNKKHPFVISFDLSRMDDLISGKLLVPRLELVKSCHVLPAPVAAITSSSYAVVSGSLAVPLNALLMEEGGRPVTGQGAADKLFYRVSSRGTQTTSGFASVSVLETIVGSDAQTANTECCAHSTLAAETNVKGPIQPLTLDYSSISSHSMANAAYLQVQAKVTTGSFAVVDLWLDIYALRP